MEKRRRKKNEQGGEEEFQRLAIKERGQKNSFRTDLTWVHRKSLPVLLGGTLRQDFYPFFAHDGFACFVGVTTTGCLGLSDWPFHSFGASKIRYAVFLNCTNSTISWSRGSKFLEMSVGDWKDSGGLHGSIRKKVHLISMDMQCAIDLVPHVGMT